MNVGRPAPLNIAVPSHRFPPDERPRPPLCVAPLMECTDTHCRVLHRALSRNALLYTEMVTAEAVLRGKRERLLGFHSGRASRGAPARRGGAGAVGRGGAVGAEFGYDEINLNVGCPSDRVQSGRFGAA